MGPKGPDEDWNCLPEQEGSQIPVIDVVPLDIADSRWMKGVITFPLLLFPSMRVVSKLVMVQ